MYLGSSVHQYGASSGPKVGKLELVEITSVPVRGWGGRLRNYSGLLGIVSAGPSLFSEPGDSGAMVFTEEGMLLGMILAANADMTFAYPIANICALLDCKLLLSNA